MTGFLVKDKSFYDTSGGGVTFSGGECMLQIDFLLKILKWCKENGIHTAVDTAGNVSWDCFLKIIPYTDLFLYDIKCFSEKLHIENTGASNKLILKNLKKLSDCFNGELIIRIPIIPGVNDNTDELRKIASYISHIRKSRIELLPYHRMGEHKYAALDMSFVSFDIPSSEKMNEYKLLFDNK